MAKKVASPALISVKNLEPFLSYLCPENSSRNRRPTKLVATAVLVLSTYVHIHISFLRNSVTVGLRYVPNP